MFVKYKPLDFSSECEGLWCPFDQPVSFKLMTKCLRSYWNIYFQLAWQNYRQSITHFNCVQDLSLLCKSSQWALLWKVAKADIPVCPRVQKQSEVQTLDFSWECEGLWCPLDQPMSFKLMTELNIMWNLCLISYLQVVRIEISYLTRSLPNNEVLTKQSE